MNLQPFSPGLRAFRALTPGNPSHIILDHCALSLCSSLTGLLISGVVPVPRLPQGITLPEYPGISFCLEHSPGSVCDCLSFQAFPSITTPWSGLLWTPRPESIPLAHNSQHAPYSLGSVNNNLYVFYPLKLFSFQCPPYHTSFRI